MGVNSPILTLESGVLSVSRELLGLLSMIGSSLLAFFQSPSLTFRVDFRSLFCMHSPYSLPYDIMDNDTWSPAKILSLPLFGYAFEKVPNILAQPYKCHQGPFQLYWLFYYATCFLSIIERIHLGESWLEKTL